MKIFFIAVLAIGLIIVFGVLLFRVSNFGSGYKSQLKNAMDVPENPVQTGVGSRLNLEPENSRNNGSEFNSEPTEKPTKSNTAPQGTAGMANPASVNCEKQGGKLEIRTASDGGQSGYCHLSNGKVCEEWALFRGECK